MIDKKQCTATLKTVTKKNLPILFVPRVFRLKFPVKKSQIVWLVPNAHFVYNDEKTREFDGVKLVFN